MDRLQLSHVQKVSRVELRHPNFAKASEIVELQRLLVREKEIVGATRAVLRVLAPHAQVEPKEGFFVEAKIRTAHPDHSIYVLGLNDQRRALSTEEISREEQIVQQIRAQQKRDEQDNFNFDIRPIPPENAFAEQLSSLYDLVYKDYIQPLDPASIATYLRNSIAYGIFEDEKIVSILFGDIYYFGDFVAVELNHAGTLPNVRGRGMTVALAHTIEEEARRRFSSPILFAETIAGPVMRSCHEFGMELVGVLRNHTHMEFHSGEVFHNLYMWSKCK